MDGDVRRCLHEKRVCIRARTVQTSETEQFLSAVVYLGPLSTSTLIPQKSNPAQPARYHFRKIIPVKTRDASILDLISQPISLFLSSFSLGAMFIALVGTPSSGKSAVLDYLVQRHEFTRLDIATPVKGDDDVVKGVNALGLDEWVSRVSYSPTLLLSIHRRLMFRTLLHTASLRPFLPHTPSLTSAFVAQVLTAFFPS